MKAMILAAGRGERLRPLTDTKPKPLVDVCGKPLIEYHLEKLANAGFQEVIINHAWLGEQIENVLGNGQRWGLTIYYSPEQKALETGGGIKNALPLLIRDTLDDAPFFVINGDIFIERLPSKAALTLASDQAAKLFLVDNPTHHPDGDFYLIDSQVTLDRKSAAKKLTFSGMGLYRPSIFESAPDSAFGLGEWLRQCLQERAVQGVHYKNYWCDVGTLARLEQAQNWFSFAN